MTARTRTMTGTTVVEGNAADPIWMSVTAGIEAGTVIIVENETDPIWTRVTAKTETGTAIVEGNEADSTWTKVTVTATAKSSETSATQGGTDGSGHANVTESSTAEVTAVNRTGSRNREALGSGAQGRP